MLTVRPTRAEIDLQRVTENVKALAELAAPAELMAVVKADGYGHGGAAVARAALAAGAGQLAVAIPEEGQALRRAAITAPILVLGALLPGQAETYLDYGLTATVATEDGIAALARLGENSRRRLRVHVKVDTGMTRLGFSVRELAAVVQRLMRLPGIELEGLYTHLACADEPGGETTGQQATAFRQALAACEEAGWRPRHVHMANTAALLQEASFPWCTAVRVGIGIYGVYPSDSVRRVVRLRPALSLKTQVASVRRVPAETGVSYGHTYRTAKETTLCTLPIGYADGLSHRLSSRAAVLIGGKRYPIVGRICMDQCIVDVGDAPVAVGAEAVLIGEQGGERITVEEWARHLGTIPYEVLCSISARVRRVYTGGPDSGALVPSDGRN